MNAVSRLAPSSASPTCTRATARSRPSTASTSRSRRGEVFGLLGPNGAGKTTTIEILEGLNKADSGEIAVLGIDPRRDAGRAQGAHRRPAPDGRAVPQPDRGRADRPVRQLLRQGAGRPQELIKRFGLEERQIALTKELSGGQRQRLSVALAMVNDPELIFLDEPTTGLDPQARRALWDQIEELRGEGRTVVLTTHYMEEAEQLCDRVAVMDHGKILEIGTVNELVTRHFHERTDPLRIAARADRRAPRRARRSRPRARARSTRRCSTRPTCRPRSATCSRVADELGLDGLDISVRRPTLEDVFLELTGRALRD